MQAAIEALEAVDSDAEEEQVAGLKDAVAKATVKYNKALKGEGTAKSMGWENNGRRNGTSYVKIYVRFLPLLPYISHV
jgi:hypothetical protein